MNDEKAAGSTRLRGWMVAESIRICDALKGGAFAVRNKG
jgi:hypothetical protein